MDGQAAAVSGGVAMKCAPLPLAADLIYWSWKFNPPRLSLWASCEFVAVARAFVVMTAENSRRWQRMREKEPCQPSLTQALEAGAGHCRSCWALAFRSLDGAWIEET